MNRVQRLASLVAFYEATIFPRSLAQRFDARALREIEDLLRDRSCF